MKRTLKLTLNEIKHLKWTVLVTALALTLFTASLFSVLFVYNDLSYNVFNYFDTTDSFIGCYAYNASISQVTDEGNDELYYGWVTCFTHRGVIINAENGNSFNTEFEKIEELENGVNVIHKYYYSGMTVYVNDKYRECYAEAMEEIPLPQNVWEILIDKEIAEGLQVDVGDKVSIDDYVFTVCGVYDYAMYRGNYYICDPFVVAVDENVVFYELEIECDSSYQVYLQYLQLQRAGVEVKYGSNLQFYMDNLSLVNSFLIAIAITIFAVNLLLLYATFSVILHNRQAYICRLKVMGASDLLVFAAYFIIIVALLVVICVAAFFLSQLMVSSIMDACGEAFGSAFTTRTSFGLVGIYFAVTTVLLGALCYLSVRKIDNRAIVTATRSD